MGNFNLEDYEPVEDRLARFWADHKNGRVHTEVLPSPASNEWVVFAAVYRDQADGVPFATGLAHEVIGQGMVNRTSALENCETSAIGRALANGGYATKGKRPSREEMTKATKGAGEPQKPPSQPIQPQTVPETVEERVKSMVFRAVQNAYKPWTPKMVRDRCATEYPRALKALEITASLEDAERITQAVLDLIKQDGIK